MDVYAEVHSQRAPRGARAKPLRVKPTYRYHWNELDFRTFRPLGLIARRSPDGCAQFNLPQTIWLFPDISMDWEDSFGPRVQTLAVNLLTQFLPERDAPAYFGVASCRAIRGAELFAQYCLLSMPRDGGCIPREFIQEWVYENL